MQKWAKYLVLLGMFVTAYMLVLAWQKDYGHAAPTIAPVSTAAAASTTADVPNAASSAPANADVPAVAVPKPALSAPAASAQPQGLITLQNDLYRLTVDPKGGDVVRAELLSHLNAGDNPQPFVLLEDDATRVFVAQSGLVGADGPDAAAGGRPQYKTPQSSYTLAQGQQTLDVPLTFDAPNGVQIIKHFILTQGKYPLQVSYQIINGGKSPWHGQMYGQVKRDNSPDPSKATQGFMGLSTFMGGVWGSPDHPYNKLSLGKFQSDALNTSTKGGWVGMMQHYFIAAWIPDHSSDAVLTTRVSGNNNFIGFTTPVVAVAPGTQATLNATLYTGPKVQDDLKPLATGLEQTVDYGWTWPIAQVLFVGLKTIHGFLGNWGWSIIVLTMLVKLVLFPLSAKSYRSMAKMRVIAPEMQRLKETHGEDRMRFSQEMMALYRKEGVNPLSGCLPILLQMPIFMSLYFVFMESVELRNAPWIGWITDLSSMDHWFVLPVLMGISQFVQQKLNPQPADPMQAKMMTMMPIVFTIFMLWFPSGLVLYWTVNNVLSIIQQRFINYQIEKSMQKASS